jgi:hypothetical protein
MLYALCSMLYALCSMLYALCSMPYALCSMLYALCSLLFALGSRLYALCPHMPKPSSKKNLRLYMALLTIFRGGFLDFGISGQSSSLKATSYKGYNLSMYFSLDQKISDDGSCETFPFLLG